MIRNLFKFKHVKLSNVLFTILPDLQFDFH